ncbi:hypothetical protein [Arthrobacter sp. NPDC056493]|uniref:hypothetical protein n=1 Tax=Arthrobacter sp. NPDC056493 TaxID=3345839 RepID=UPI00366BFFD8
MGRIIGWLTAAVVVTALFGSVYLVLQQVERRSANDAPAAAAAAQVQLIGAGTASAGPRLELTPDSGVFILVYGADDRPESGTATLHKELPLIPAGVLEAARRTGYDAVTWQPEPGLRLAIIARPSDGRVIVAGQSLAPYEDRDGFTLAVLALGWLGSVLVIAAGYAATGYLLRRGRGPDGRG